jgi:hypothetical protein
MNKYIKANLICAYRFCQLYGISEGAILVYLCRCEFLDTVRGQFVPLCHFEEKLGIYMERR